MKTLKEYYTQICKDGNYDYSNEGLLEHLMELPTVFEDSPDEHRWYTNNNVTVKIIIDKEDRYFNVCYPSCTGDGDLAWEDYEIPAEEYAKVYPRQEMRTVYRMTKEEL